MADLLIWESLIFLNIHPLTLFEQVGYYRCHLAQKGTDWSQKILELSVQNWGFFLMWNSAPKLHKKQWYHKKYIRNVYIFSTENIEAIIALNILTLSIFNLVTRRVFVYLSFFFCSLISSKRLTELSWNFVGWFLFSY